MFSTDHFLESWNVYYGLLIVISSYIIYRSWLNPNKDLWKNQGILELSNYKVKNLFRMLRKTDPEIQYEDYKKHGRLYGTFEGKKPVLVVCEPELLKNILSKDFHIFPNRRSFKLGDEIFDNVLSNVEGEVWKRIRSIVTQTFSTGKIRKMSTLVQECADSLFKNLEESADKTVNIKEYFGAFTMDVISTCAFGVKLDSHKDPNNPFVTMAKRIFTPRISLRMILLLTLPQKISRMLGVSLADKDLTTFFANASKKIINQRTSGKETDKNDYLQLLLDAQKESHESIGKGLSEVEVVAQCVLFFLAGYDTTANTLSYTAYNLAMYPDVQKLLQEEVDSASQKGELDFDTIMNMKYLDAVISETLRLHTIAIRLERIASEDYTLNNITVPKGTIIGIPISAMHHDEEWFPEPEKYKPERFFPENKDQITPYTYMPFGTGPRNCVAMRFAIMEAKFALVKAIQQLEFVATDETKAGLTFYKMSGLRQAYKVPIKIIKRNKI